MRKPFSIWSFEVAFVEIVVRSGLSKSTPLSPPVFTTRSRDQRRRQHRNFVDCDCKTVLI
ncbi:hypothetical protein C0Z16_06005 [Paraburkholderia rhynchosiae]|uniref:Uncharacterized protein n=1 Tax=Paraburkholderia rhynchosiae TaxID=487049 RepID=A0ABX4VD67_9BURK|nr:hypothetical protein C0Z16_06005 [Paraburkholderia rhynchosiae]